MLSVVPPLFLDVELAAVGDSPPAWADPRARLATLCPGMDQKGARSGRLSKGGHPRRVGGLRALEFYALEPQEAHASLELQRNAATLILCCLLSTG